MKKFVKMKQFKISIILLTMLLLIFILINPTRLLLLGNLDLYNYAMAYVFASIGMLLTKLIQLQNRNKKSPKTPYSFSISFYFKDNFLNILINFVLLFIAFRFCTEVTGREFSMWVAFCLGSIIDTIVILIKNRTKNFIK